MTQQEVNILDWSEETFVQLCRRKFGYYSEGRFDKLEDIIRKTKEGIEDLDDRILRADPLLFTSNGYLILDDVANRMSQGHLIASDETRSGNMKQDILIEGAKRNKRWAEVVDLTDSSKVKVAELDAKWREFLRPFNSKKVRGVDVILMNETVMYIVQVKSGLYGFNSASDDANTEALEKAKERAEELFPDLIVKTCTLVLTGMENKPMSADYITGEMAWAFATENADLPYRLIPMLAKLHVEWVDQDREKKVMEKLQTTIKERLRDLKLVTCRNGVEVVEWTDWYEFSSGCLSPRFKNSKKLDISEVLVDCEMRLTIGEEVILSERFAKHYGKPSIGYVVKAFCKIGNGGYVELAHKDDPSCTIDVPMFAVTPIDSYLDL